MLAQKLVDHHTTGDFVLPLGLVPQPKRITQSSLLGEQQKEWLIESMKTSDADFHFVVSSVNFMIPHVGGGGADFDVALKDDAWTAFLDERETLIAFWDSLGRPVFVVGDGHLAAVRQLVGEQFNRAESGEVECDHGWVSRSGLVGYRRVACTLVGFCPGLAGFRVGV